MTGVADILADPDALATVRERAEAALREGQFDLAEELIASGDVTLAALIENLRIYQAELEIQNEELRRSQHQAEAALAQFAALFQTLPVAELVLDCHGLVIDANASAQHLFQLRGGGHRHFLIRLIDEPDRGRVVDAIARLTARDALAFEVRGVQLHSSDGAPFVGDLHLALLPGAAADGSDLAVTEAAGRRPGAASAGGARLVCAVLDRTEAVRQHEALQSAYQRLEQAQEAYRVLAEFSPDWDYWCGPDGEFRHVSPGCQAVTGWAAEAFMQDTELMARLVHPDDLTRWREHQRAEKLSLGPEQNPLTFRIRHRDGAERVIEHACRPVIATDGRSLGRRGVNRDVTARFAAERALREREATYLALFESASQGLAILRDGRLASVNHALVAMLGYPTREALHGLTPADLSPVQQPDGEASATKAHRLLAAALGGTPQRHDWVLQDAAGQPLQVEISLMRIAFGGAPALLAITSDLTGEIVARAREQRAAVVFENTTEGIVVTDANANIVAVNRAFSEITGYSEAEAIGQNPRILQSGRHEPAFYQGLWATLLGTGQWRGEFWNRRKSGEIYAQRSTITAVRDAEGRVGNYIGVIADITDVKRSEEAIYHLAHHDALTGLPNRALLRARVEQSLARAARDDTLVALLYIDLDMFKTVNDSLGHPVGDGLLQGVAHAMAGLVRAGDSIARIGGDEFAVLMDDVRDPRHAADLAGRLLAACTNPFVVQGHELYITASIGISVYPMDGTDLDTLLRHADLAMYQSKEQGRNAYRFFKPAMTAGALERLHLENALRGALARSELRLEYQPQVRLADRRLQGVEALLRWQDRSLGEVSPERFVPIAEEIGLIGELGRWVLEHACHQLLAWDAAGVHIPRMAVNLSVRQIERPDLLDLMRKTLARTGLAPARLELEVTESMLMRHVEQVMANLRALRAIGIQIAVDDFGSGYSSLGYLQHLPIDRVKIDRVFVAEAVEDSRSAAIVRTIIALGHGLGLEVIAEGVETEAQARFLQQEGCAEAQGFLFGRAMDADAIALLPAAQGVEIA